MSCRLRPEIRLVENGQGAFLMREQPLAVLRINGALAGLVKRLLADPNAQISAGEEQTLEQLVSRGFAERVTAPAGDGGALPTVSIVIPVKDRAEELARCLDSLARLAYPQEKLQVIVVDDGSSDMSPDLARRCGALVVPSGGTGRGPAAARNVGARAATGEILAFIDSDCTASTGWLGELLPAFADPKIAAVGGLVDGMCTESAVDRYEAVMSSLSLGSRDRSGSGGDDTFYLPSCNLLVRRGLFLGVGGFRDEMHVGEDVDLTWRLRDSGFTISYLPVGRVYHEHRSSLRSFMSRRFDYGTSEGMLQRLHPQRRKRMVVPPLLALLLALCLAGPLVSWWSLPLAASLLLVDVAAVRRRLGRRGVPLGARDLLAGRLRALGSLVYYLSYHLVRYYTLPLAAVALFMPLFWLVPVAAWGCAAGVDHAVRKPQLSFVPYAGIYLLEQLAYGAGVFWGCLRRNSFSSYRVVLLRQMEVTTS